jgi:hypothetical protein
MLEIVAQGAVTESNEMTVGNLFKSFKEAPGKLLSRFGVSAPEEIFDSVTVEVLFHWQNSLLVQLVQLVGRNCS